MKRRLALLTCVAVGTLVATAAWADDDWWKERRKAYREWEKDRREAQRELDKEYREAARERQKYFRDGRYYYRRATKSGATTTTSRLATLVTVTRMRAVERADDEWRYRCGRYDYYDDEDAPPRTARRRTYYNF